MIMKFSRLLLTLGLVISSPSVQAAGKENTPPGATPKEMEMGRKASEALEKSPKIKFLDEKEAANKALVEKLNKMAEELGKASARPDIKYVVKVIDDKDINAFTLPSGKIYFYKGLIDFANNDDEIAAVMAHEIGHNAHFHALRGEAKARKLSWVGLAAMLAALGAGRDGAGIAQMSQYLLLGIMNGYGVAYEKEADSSAIGQMKKTTYNPAALVTFMNRLSFEEKAHPEIELGIFRTHPPSEERATAIKEQMTKEGIEFNPRDVTGGREAKVVEKEKSLIVERAGVALFELAFTDVTKKAVQQRAGAAADVVNNLMRDNLKLHEVRTESVGNEARLIARGQEIIVCATADAALQKITPLDCLQKWRDNWGRLFWKEAVGGKS
jgi:predicted Zn-dependent protease